MLFHKLFYETASRLSAPFHSLFRSLFTFYVLCSEKKKLLEKTRKLEN